MNRGVIRRVLTFLQRWIVVNALYHISFHRDMRVWIPEHDLCEWIAGGDIQRDFAWRKDSFIREMNYKFKYFFFRVKNHDQLYQKIRNVIYDCEHIEPIWIRRTKSNDGISDRLCLSPRGNEVYAFSYLWLTSGPAQKVWTAILAGLVIWYAIERIQQIIPQEPQKIQIEWVNAPAQMVQLN